MKVLIMHFYSSYMLILLFLHQYLAKDKIDQLSDKNKKNAVDELLRKIGEISDQTFKNSSYHTKLEMLRKVEIKLRKAASSLGSKGERYVKLIMKGIKARALEEISGKSDSRTQLEIPVDIDNIPKLKEKTDILNDNLIIMRSNESPGGTEKNDDLIFTSESFILNRKNETNDERGNKDINKNDNSVLNEHLRRMVIVSSESNERHNHENSVTREPTTERLAEKFTPHYECESSLDNICLNIKQMKQIQCHFDDSFIPIEKLCDGFTDCIDGTDEKFCTSQVSERLQNANQVIHQTDESFQLGCFPNKTKDSIMTSQIIILRSVLQAQQEFVTKYKYFNHSIFSNNEYHLTGEGTVKNAVNEISLIISTLGLVLESELCSRRIKPGDEITARKFNDLLIEDFDKIMEEVDWPPKSCACKGERCENVTTCTNTCKRVCWQKHIISRWECPSINETENVPMSVICDGKFDCYDQSDEKDCVTGVSYAKFEAHKIFKEIMTTLSVKVASTEYAFIRNMILSLHSNIGDLQKFCMAPEPDLKIIRILRNKCFSTLTSIYSETLTKSSFLYQKSEVYVFLLSLRENIVDALKRSHTGNKRIITNDRCYCRNGQCSMPICSSNCQRSCIAEPWLTRYFCENNSNKSVALEDICNGKPNCPGEDDETLCQKEICRRHHLSVLRRNIQKIGRKQEGTSMGELLIAWKLKVSSTLMIAERNGALNLIILRDIIRDILNDLVNTYGALKDYRRDNEYALEEFSSIARYVMRSIRSCGH